MQFYLTPWYLRWSAPLVWTELSNHLSVPKKGLIKHEDFCSCDLLTTILDHTAQQGSSLRSVYVKTSPDKS